MKKRTQIIVFVVSLLLIGGTGAGYIIHKHNEAQQEQKEKELKIIEDEIVADLAKRYKGIEAVQFEEYSIAPTGMLDIPCVINNKKTITIRYQMYLNEKMPRFAGGYNLEKLRNGSSDLNKIKIVYNFKEFGK
ncbi:hypothetical protein Q2T76_01950 [Lactobacillus sp. YT155]|uniref:hypothetical protein n=1 Tax=Lactobacillus sp. YT155 TaxID=3060955 RepID=UPI00265FCF11|nr:hypothetical protein [Lactobacillus sp. YT155]MDO1604812.1 hypothetical protein [Lactobacillus sp. YT155]